MKKQFIIHPFLFAIFPVLFLYSHNLAELSLPEILPLSATALGFTFLLVLLIRSILKEKNKTGLVVFVILVLFFSYGHTYDVTKGFQIGSFIIGRHRYLLFIWSILLIICVFFIVKTNPTTLHFINNSLNIMAVSLTIFTLINIIIYELKSDISNNDSININEANQAVIEKNFKFRDIYYIILDGYASSTTLKEVFNFDNSEFTEYLKHKGFYIASRSQSNYDQTRLSLASSLNMEYLNNLAENLGEESIDMRVPNKMIKDNKVKDFLKSKGYKFIHFSSGVGATDYNHLADINFQSGINEVLAVFIKTTALRPFEKRLIGDDARERILYTFSKLAEINRIKGPKFIFAHFISPHPPYLFDDNGVPVPGASLNMRGPEVWGQKEDYLRQLIFINKKVKILVDTLLSKSSISPVIIFQADHGPASRLPDLYSSDWDQPAQSIVRERTGILNALYLPEGGKELLYDSISPVNTFRLIFNYYFNANYELLNDQCFHSSYRYPYKFVNVTPKAIN